MFERSYRVGGFGRHVRCAALLAVALGPATALLPAGDRGPAADRELFSGWAATARASELAGLIRSKTPDRDSYRPPVLPSSPAAQSPAPQPASQPQVPQPAASDDLPWAYDDRQVAAASYTQHALHPAPAGGGAPAPYAAHARGGQVSYHEPGCGFPLHAGGHDTCGCASGCDTFGGGCDGLGGSCDGFCDGGCDGRGMGRSVRLTDPCQWFGSVELLMMFRSGDRLPILATTSASGEGEGTLPVGPPGDTRVLFGGQRVLDDMTVGGRVTLGTWLDDQQCRSLVFRGWGTGDESFHFNADSGQYDVIARPFLNTSGANPINDSLVISSPELGRTGSLAIHGSSEVYGGDVALRQTWLAGLGGVVEVLYGYQHLRMQEDLSIASSFLELPNAIDVSDRFEAENEFHGGQIGLATRYREGCWSFNGLIKVAGGSLRRTADLQGRTTIGPPASSTPEGLLIRNSGKTSNSTFAWVPELDATLGYRYTQNLDFTVGYHLVALSDAVQVSGLIDRQLAVDTNGPARRPAMRSDTFYIHGIHFGLQYVY